MEEIVGVFGHIEARWYLVKYAGYAEPEWSRGHLLERDGCRDTIRAFWAKSGLSPCQVEARFEDTQDKGGPPP